MPGKKIRDDDLGKNEIEIYYMKTDKKIYITLK